MFHYNLNKEIESSHFLHTKLPLPIKKLYVCLILISMVSFLLISVARSHLLLQKRDSKSFDTVALHKNQMLEECAPMDEKAHQSLDCGLYGDGANKENVINGGDENRMTNQSNDENAGENNDQPDIDEAAGNEVKIYCLQRFQ